MSTPPPSSSPPPAGPDPLDSAAERLRQTQPEERPRALEDHTRSVGPEERARLVQALRDRGLLTPEQAWRMMTVDAVAGAPATGPATKVVQPSQPLMPPGAAAGSIAAVPGVTLDRFRLEKRLGEGGMGTVWRAWDAGLERTVALKLIKLEEPANPEAAARFLREARLAAKLRHPNIVTIHDVGSMGGLTYISMDFIDGRTFADYLNQSRALGMEAVAERLRAAVGILAQVAEAVGYAHREGIIHRDLKPANILLDRDDRPSVGDFGLAKEVVVEGGAGRRPTSAPLTQTGQILGTPAYMSPEQVAGDPAGVGPASDVWGLGVMLYQVLTGCLPFGGEQTYQVIYSVMEGLNLPPRQVARGVPEELENVCLAALERQREHRYPTAAELGEDLRRWLGGQPVRARRPGVLRRLSRWSRRNRAGLVRTGLGLALVAGALGLAWHERARRAEQAHAQLAEIAAAVAAFEDSVRRTGAPPDAARLLAEQPLGLLGRWIADDPDHGPAYAWRGKVKEILGDVEGAAADFDRGCALAPEREVVWYLRGMSRIGRYAEARRLPGIMYGSTGPRFAPPASESPEEAGLRTQGLADLAWMARAGGQDPALTDDERRIGRAMAAIYRGEAAGNEEAVRLLEGCSGPRAARLLGLAFYHLQRFEPAAEAFGRTLAQWPADTQARLWRAAAWHALGEVGGTVRHDAEACYRQAIADYGDVLRAHPELLWVRIDRGDTWRALGDSEVGVGQDPRDSFSQAILDCTQVLRRAPDWTPAYVTRALAHLSLARALATRRLDPSDEYAAAIADCGETLRRAPKDVAARVNRAAACVSLGQAEAAAGRDPRASYRRAIEDGEAVVRAAPDVVEARINSGNARTLLAQLDEGQGGDPRPALEAAIADWTALLARRPQFVNAVFARGQAYARLGAAQAARGQDAAESFRRGEADLKDAVGHGIAAAHLHLGLLYRAAGRTVDAIAALEAAAAADPAQAPQIRALIDELRRTGK